MSKNSGKLRWGLIGCGDIAEKRVAPALRDLPNCDLVGVSRARAGLAAQFAGRFQVPKTYARWQELLADPEIQAVYIATPVDLHAEQTIAAAQAGKHVLCEKPMALNVSQCDRMIEACQGHQVHLGIAYYRRFYPLVKRIQEILHSKEIGRPVIVQINAFEAFDLPPGHPRHWFLEPERAGGGPMFDFGCHRIEVLQHLFGPIQDLVSSVGRVVFQDRRVEDTAACIIEFEAGARGLLTVTHGAWESQDTLEVFATRGSLHVPFLNRGEMTVALPEGGRTEKHPPDPNFHRPLIDDFTQAVLEDRSPAVGGAVGREVARVLELIYAGDRGPASGDLSIHAEGSD